MRRTRPDDRPRDPRRQGGRLRRPGRLRPGRPGPRRDPARPAGRPFGGPAHRPARPARALTRGRPDLVRLAQPRGPAAAVVPDRRRDRPRGRRPVRRPGHECRHRWRRSSAPSTTCIGRADLRVEGFTERGLSAASIETIADDAGSRRSRRRSSSGEPTSPPTVASRRRAPSPRRRSPSSGSTRYVRLDPRSRPRRRRRARGAPRARRPDHRAHGARLGQPIGDTLDPAGADGPALRADRRDR